MRCVMDFSVLIKELRLKLLLSQADFAKEIGVSFSTVNRWETGKTRPNYKAIKSINEYCKSNNVDFCLDKEVLEVKK